MYLARFHLTNIQNGIRWSLNGWDKALFLHFSHEEREI